MTAFAGQMSINSEEILRQTFNKLDIDGNGYIDAEEMAVILKAEHDYQTGDWKNEIAWLSLLK